MEIGFTFFVYMKIIHNMQQLFLLVSVKIVSL